MNEEVRIGFIGCGGNARGHMQQIADLSGARIVAVCDVIPELANRAAETYGAVAYTSHRRLLKRPDLDTVYISIPVFAHGRPELDTIDRGLPFFVEKPVAINLHTAKRIAEAVVKKNLITCVGYQLRYSGAAEIAKEILDGATVGLVSGMYWSGTGRGDASQWIRQMVKSGGQLVEQATHTIDMMRYLIGEITEVYTKQRSRLLRTIDCPDTNCLTFEFASGVIGSMTATWAYDPSDWSHANVLDITFDQSVLHWTYGGVSVTKDGQTAELTRPDRSIDAVFIEAVRTGDGSAIRSPYTDGVKSLAVSLAANRSGKTGRPEKIKEVS
ncbi:MAG: Gfo/Idh/MocA family oxidoreductase [Candidatus Latescibacteria bacterium]|nr:Gfo/Idh/MocA family oxidoreductase [Candidatus Latescibacterota bacterium]